MPDLNVNDKAFLDLFPRPERSTIANLFLGVIRAGTVDTEGRVIAAVVTELVNKTASAEDFAARYGESTWGVSSAERGERYRQWRATLDANFDDAVRYARFCLEYERLPRAERGKYKASGSGGREVGAWKTDPATEPQKSLLREKGFRGDVEALTKGEASEAITALLGKGKRS